MTDVVLPLSGHMAGRAAPLPAPAREAQAPEAAPQPESGKPAGVVIPVDDSDDPDVSTALTDAATADEIAAAAGRFHRGAELAAERAERDRAEAERMLEDARAEAARIVAEAEAGARPFITSYAAAGKEAAELAERAGRLERATVLAVQAEEADARVAALEDERDGLAARAADIGERLSQLADDRRELEPQLAAARDGDDDDLITRLRNRLDSIGDRETALTAQRAPLLTRLDAIGDGEMSPIWPQKELAEARRVAGWRSVHDALNWAFPDRPQAIADKAREHAQMIRRLAEERGAESPQRRTIVQL